MLNFPKTVLCVAMAMALSEQATAAALKLNVYQEGDPVSQAEIRLNGEIIGRSDSRGQFIYQNLDGGRHELELLVDGEAIPYRFSVADDQAALVTVNGQPGSAKPLTSIQRVALAEWDGGENTSAATGTVQGLVQATDSGKPLRRALVQVEGQQQTALTDRDGRFKLVLPAGEYIIDISHPEYRGSRLREVRVLPAMDLALDASLEPGSSEGRVASGPIEEVLVRARYTEASAIQIEKFAAGVVDSVDIEQLSRFDDSTVSSAIRRVVGVTLEEGRFPIVRGLKSRYQSSYFNGTVLPSTDPSRRDLPLDIFPSGIMQGIDLQKTATANVPGSATAGHISMRTRDIPDEPFFKVSASITRGDNHSDDALQSTTEGNTDWLGMDDGSRDVPGPVRLGLGVYSSSTSSSTGTYIDPATREAMGEAMRHNAITRGDVLGDVSFDLVGGDSWQDDNEQSLGFIAALRYANSWNIDTKQGSRFGRQNLSDPDSPIILRSLTETEDTNNTIDLSGMFNLRWVMNDYNEFGLNNILLRHTTHSAELETQITLSSNYKDPFAEIKPDDDATRTQRVDWFEEQLLALQLWGKHRIPLAQGRGWASYLGDLELSWQAVDAIAKFDRPNATQYRYEGTVVDTGIITVGSVNQYHVWEEMREDSNNYRVDLELPLESIAGISWTFQTGFTNQRRERDATYDRFTFRGSGGGAGLPTEVRKNPDPRQIFTPTYIGPESGQLSLKVGNILPEDDVGLAGDDYVSRQRYEAYYFLAKANINQVLDINLGVRQESFTLDAEQYEYTREPLVNLLDEDRELPSLLLNYMFSDTLQLRAAYSKTVGWPESFEMLPRLFYDLENLDRYQGNPDLKPADIENYDLRLEWYPSNNESLTLAWFTKDLSNAIENRFVGTSDNFEFYTFNNIGDAEIDGWELDLRKVFVLGSLQGHEIFVQFNYTDIRSSVDIPPEFQATEYDPDRPLQGQPDYIANLQVGYDHLDSGQQFTLIFNRKGEELAVVSPPGLNSVANVYEQPYNDLKFVYRKNFNNGVSISFSVDNLLDEERLLEYEGYNAPYYRATPGRDYKLKFNYSF